MLLDVMTIRRHNVDPEARDHDVNYQSQEHQTHSRVVKADADVLVVQFIDIPSLHYD